MIAQAHVPADAGPAQAVMRRLIETREAMALRPMDDLIIILPGIMGSVLTKHGRDLWAPSLSAVSRVLQRETMLRDLMLDGDDPEREVLDDGVVATRLMPDVQLIPGFWKIDG